MIYESDLRIMARDLAGEVQNLSKQLRTQIIQGYSVQYWINTMGAYLTKLNRELEDEGTGDNVGPIVDTWTQLMDQSGQGTMKELFGSNFT